MAWSSLHASMGLGQTLPQEKTLTLATGMKKNATWTFFFFLTDVDYLLFSLLKNNLPYLSSSPLCPDPTHGCCSSLIFTASWCFSQQDSLATAVQQYLDPNIFLKSITFPNYTNPRIRCRAFDLWPRHSLLLFSFHFFTANIFRFFWMWSLSRLFFCQESQRLRSWWYKFFSASGFLLFP